MLSLFNLKVFWAEMHRHAFTPKNRVANRLLDLQVEGVSPLILPRLKVAFVADAAVINLMLAELVSIKLFEQLG